MASEASRGRYDLDKPENITGHYRQSNQTTWKNSVIRITRKPLERGLKLKINLLAKFCHPSCDMNFADPRILRGSIYCYCYYYKYHILFSTFAKSRCSNGCEAFSLSEFLLCKLPVYTGWWTFSWGWILGVLEYIYVVRTWNFKTEVRGKLFTMAET